MTHKLGSHLLFTRDTHCLQEPSPPELPGFWKVARSIVDDDSKQLITNFGFHEKGKMVGSSIYWRIRSGQTYTILPIIERKSWVGDPKRNQWRVRSPINGENVGLLQSRAMKSHSTEYTALCQKFDHMGRQSNVVGHWKGKLQRYLLVYLRGCLDVRSWRHVWRLQLFLVGRRLAVVSY